MRMNEVEYSQPGGMSGLDNQTGGSIPLLANTSNATVEEDEEHEDSKIIDECHPDASAIEINDHQIPQFAIVQPCEASSKMVLPSSKDLDVTGDDLLPQMLGVKWPHAADLELVQSRHDISSEHLAVSAGLCDSLALRVAWTGSGGHCQMI